MSTRNSILVGAVVLLWATAWLIPSAALANTKCLCNNGEIVQSMEDMDDEEDVEVCEDACDMFGGGQKWDPRLDRDYGGDDINLRRHERGRAHH